MFNHKNTETKNWREALNTLKQSDWHFSAFHPLPPLTGISHICCMINVQQAAMYFKHILL